MLNQIKEHILDVEKFKRVQQKLLKRFEFNI